MGEMKVFNLSFVPTGGHVQIISAHASLAGAKRRAKAFGGHHGMAWCEHNSHGPSWDSIVEHGRYCVMEMGVKP